MPVSVEILPEGSIATDVATNYAGQTLNGNVLDGLADGVSSESLSFTNLSGATNAKVIVLLQTFDPVAASPIVSITDGVSQYDLPVSGANSAKRLEWNNIPVSFLTSFAVVNSTGTTFPAAGNVIHVLPI